MTYIAYGAVVSDLIPAVEIIIRGYCFHRLAKPFMGNKKASFLAGVAYVLIMLLLYPMPFRLTYFAACAIGVLAAFLVMCRMDRRNYWQKLFITVTFFSLSWFVSAMAEILYDKTYSFAGNTNFMARHMDDWFALYIAVCFFYLAMEFLFIAIGIWCILKVFSYRYADMSGKEFFMLAIPSFMGVAGYGIIWYYRNFYIIEMGTTPDLYDVLSFLYCAASVITIVVVIALYQSSKVKQEEKRQAEILAIQMESIRQHIAQVENLYQNIRSIKHDMANHILTLERLYARNKFGEANDYSTKLKAALTELTGEIKSGNPVTDVILQELKNEAEKKGIRFYSEFYYPTGSNINAFDVSVILNNALQNAMENIAREEPYISICSYCKNNAYMIEISNSFTGDLQWDTERELPMTSKRNTDGHGYGLSNIRRVAGKYAGDIDISLKDGEFCLCIMLMMEQ